MGHNSWSPGSKTLFCVSGLIYDNCPCLRSRFWCARFFGIESCVPHPTCDMGPTSWILDCTISLRFSFNIYAFFVYIRFDRMFNDTKEQHCYWIQVLQGFVFLLRTN